MVTFLEVPFIEVHDQSNNRMYIPVNMIKLIAENGGQVELLLKDSTLAFFLKESFDDVKLALGGEIRPRAQTLAKIV